jgi:uncharacterized protein (DUF58 family)
MIAFFIVFAAVLYLAEKYSLGHSLDGVEFQTRTDRILVEPEESFLWSVRIANKKRMMVPGLRIREHVPEGLFFEDTKEPVEKSRGSGLISTMYLAGMEEVMVRRRVLLKKRGRYFFRGLTAEAGDLLGITQTTGYYQALEEIVVKPERYHSETLPLLLGGYLGEFSAKQSILEDPVLIRGFREYTGREPFRAISWTQSARHDRLLVREFERMADVSCTVLLNTDGPEENRGELLERCFSIVRSICEELEKKQIPYDFYTNGIIAGAMGSWNRVEEGVGGSHLETVLEGLGRMTYETREREEEFLARVLRGNVGRRGTILITPEAGEATTQMTERLKERTGQHVLVITAKEQEE